MHRVLGIYWSLLFLFVAHFSLGQNQENLIPRKILFGENVRKDFKLSTSCHYVLYRESRAANTLFFKSTENPSVTDSIVFDGAILSYHCNLFGVIVIIADDNEQVHVQRTYLKTKEISSIGGIPDSLTSAKVLRTSSNLRSIAFELNCTEQSRNGIYKFDVLINRIYKIHETPPYSQYLLDGELQPCAANASNELGGNKLLSLENNEWKVIESVPWSIDMLLGGFSKIISVSNDGNKLYFTSNKNTDKSQLYVYHKQTGKSEKIAHHNDVDLLPFAFTKDPDGNVETVVGLFAKTVRVYNSDLAQHNFESIQAKLDGDISFLDANPSNTKWLIRELSGQPSKVYYYDCFTEKLTYITSDDPKTSSHKLAKRYAYVVETSDSLKLPIHVYLPPDVAIDENGIPKEQLPTILYVHGGPWLGVVHWNQRFHWRNLQLLANRGYAVVNCEFRGSSGLGKEFFNKSSKKWGTDMTQDIKEISDWCIENKISQPEKIGLFGWSYGGYAALAGPAFYPNQYACAISMYGISDLESFVKTDFVNTDLWRNMVGNYKKTEDVKLLKEHSPINYVKRFKAPILLTTGSKDRRIPQIQIDQMADTLSKYNKEVVYFYYPEEGHDYRQPESWLSFWAISEQFLSDHLGGKYEQAGKDIESGNFVIAEGANYISKMQSSSQ